MSDPLILSLYTDGSSDHRTRFGGFAYAITDGPTAEALLIADESQGRKDTTNNRMELQAVISGLKMCRSLYGSVNRVHTQEMVLAGVPNHTTINVYSDSAYVVNCFVQKWYRQWIANDWVGSAGPVMNIDLWKELLQLVNDMCGEGFKIEWVHVHGHRSTYWNNRCDALAVSARKYITGQSMSID